MSTKAIHVAVHSQRNGNGTEIEYVEGGPGQPSSVKVPLIRTLWLALGVLYHLCWPNIRLETCEVFYMNQSDLALNVAF